MKKYKPRLPKLGFGRRYHKPKRAVFQASNAHDYHLKRKGTTLTAAILEWMEPHVWYSRRELIDGVFIDFDLGAPSNGAGAGVLDKLWRRGDLVKAEGKNLEPRPDIVAKCARERFRFRLP